MLNSILAISVGASFGAIFRWLLGTSLNAILPTLPLGTLVANLLGGYLIGIAIAFFSANPNLPPEWRLLVITGFLGGLTTFSTFSAEVTSLLQAGRLAWAGGAICVHVLGSLAMTLAGMWSMSMLQRM